MPGCSSGFQTPKRWVICSACTSQAPVQEQEEWKGSILPLAGYFLCRKVGCYESATGMDDAYCKKHALALIGGSLQSRHVTHHRMRAVPLPSDSDRVIPLGRHRRAYIWMMWYIIAADYCEQIADEIFLMVSVWNDFRMVPCSNCSKNRSIDDEEQQAGWYLCRSCYESVPELMEVYCKKHPLMRESLHCEADTSHGMILMILIISHTDVRKRCRICSSS